MPKLSNLPISVKLLLVIAVSVLCLAGVALTGLFSVRQVAESAQRIDSSAEEIRIGSRISQNALQLSRWEFRVAADPEVADESRARIAEIKADLEDRIARASAYANPEQARLLAEIEARYAAYEAEVQRTLAAAQAVNNVELSAGQQRVLESARNSREAMDALTDAITAYVGATDAAVNERSAEAQEIANASSLAMMIGAALGAILALVLSVLFGRIQIVTPIKRVVSDIGRLARGEIDFEVTGADRGDEIGDLNRALVKFQEDARERLELVAKQEEEAQRKLKRAQEVQELTNAFQARIDEAISTLASAAQEMEATATSMSSTAEETSAETQSVSSLTTQTSANVQTVATATEELSTAIAEVSSQIARTAPTTVGWFRSLSRAPCISSVYISMSPCSA